jgi:hypothetical protein
MYGGKPQACFGVEGGEGGMHGGFVLYKGVSKEVVVSDEVCVSGAGSRWIVGDH